MFMITVKIFKINTRINLFLPEMIKLMKKKMLPIAGVFGPIF